MDIVRKLLDKVTAYALLKDSDLNDNKCFIMDQYRLNEFYSIIIDIGAARKSTASYNQYTTYKKLFGKKPINAN